MNPFEMVVLIVAITLIPHFGRVAGSCPAVTVARISAAP